MSPAAGIGARGIVATLMQLASSHMADTALPVSTSGAFMPPNGRRQERKAGGFVSGCRNLGRTTESDTEGVSELISP